MRDSRSVRLLPFSCLCDGGNCREDEYRIHRHGIAVCRELKDFTDMFSRVRFTTRKHKDQKCKSYVKIKSRHHLCNTINYVSGRKSGCTGKSLHKSKKSSKKNHFHIFRPLCPHANLFLHACYDAGPQEYYEQLHGNRDVWDKEVKWEDGKAYILVSELPRDGCSPPLDLFGRPISRYQEDLRFFLTKPQKRVARELEMDRAKKEKEKEAMRLEKDSEIAKLQSDNAKLCEEKDRELLLKDFEIERLKSESANIRNGKNREIQHAREIAALKDDFNELRVEMHLRLEAKDKEIKQLLIDQLAATVNRNLEDVNLREENKRSLIEHHAEIVRLMEEKMELKDKICALFERVVCTWLADSKKRKLCTN